MFKIAFGWFDDFGFVANSYSAAYKYVSELVLSKC